MSMREFTLEREIRDLTEQKREYLCALPEASTLGLEAQDGLAHAGFVNVAGQPLGDGELAYLIIGDDEDFVRRLETEALKNMRLFSAFGSLRCYDNWVEVDQNPYGSTHTYNRNHNKDDHTIIRKQVKGRLTKIFAISTQGDRDGYTDTSPEDVKAMLLGARAGVLGSVDSAVQRMIGHVSVVSYRCGDQTPVQVYDAIKGQIHGR